jgi:hypothetical protein
MSTVKAAFRGVATGITADASLAPIASAPWQRYATRRVDTSSFCASMKLHIRLLLTSITGASPQAPRHSQFLKRENTIRGGFIQVNPEPGLQIFSSLLPIPKLAGQVGAHPNLKAADRLEVLYML